MNVELVQVKQSEKSILRQLMELYAYDFSQYDQADVNEHGFYGYNYLDHYWTEENRHPFFIKVDGNLAGLVLVSYFTYALKDNSAMSISEFFIMRRYRRKGIGKIAAFEVFDQFPGRWEVNQHGDNGPSKLFWEKIISEYTHGAYKIQPVTTEDWTGQAITFDNSKS